jgi:hypothetical protein
MQNKQQVYPQQAQNQGYPPQNQGYPPRVGNTQG